MQASLMTSSGGVLVTMMALHSVNCSSAMLPPSTTTVFDELLRGRQRKISPALSSLKRGGAEGTSGSTGTRFSLGC
jgi:hypothetical protein